MRQQTKINLTTVAVTVFVFFVIGGLAHLLTSGLSTCS